MTTESDLRAGNKGQPASPETGRPGGKSKPASVEINMPKSGGTGQASARTSAGAGGSVEAMLEKLMQRLDDNDRRYGEALNHMNSRLDDMANRTRSATAESSEALDRVREQASSLAAQISQAGQAYQSQAGSDRQVPGLTGANDDAPGPFFAESQLRNDFADVTERLEQSLAANSPASEFDVLSHRVDDLVQRMDSALSGNGNPQTLQSIEEQLSALRVGFAEASRSYARVEAIEQHLLGLMNWAQSMGAPGGDGGSERLDHIEHCLSALNENTREMDARTVGTLEAMNEALHSLAASLETSTPETPKTAAQPKRSAPKPPPVQEQAQETEESPEDYAEVEISSREEPGIIEEPNAELEEQLGAAIPDYEPAPAKPKRKAKATTERVEPTFSGETDFIAAARQAAEAADLRRAMQAEKPSRNERLVDRISARTGKSVGKPRKILTYVGAALLLTTAGFAYLKLSGGKQQVAPAIPAPTQTQKPATGAVPAPAQKPAPVEPKKQSDRMQAPAKGDENLAEAGPQRQQAPGRSEVAPRPSPASLAIDPNKPLSTATVLASIKPDATPEQMPGVSVTISEPAQRAPAPRSQSAATGSAALVPSSGMYNQPSSLAQPKRIPATAPSKPDRTVNVANVDSSRAVEITPQNGSSLSNMPPARIGPTSLRTAAARGNPAAQVEIASRYAKGTGVKQDMAKALEWYKRAASQGYAPGQYRLAALYERGKGVKKDMGMARTWYRRAAELGNVRAMHNLAVLYTRDEGQKADYIAAKNWFHQAARHGLADSQFNLGILYESGLGAQKNIAEAYKWYSLAASQGDGEARKRREAIRPQLPAKSLAGVEKSLKRWRKATANSAANHVGPPKGGWQNAQSGKTAAASDPALIARAQFLLNKLGYDAGVPDGKAGPQTKTAIRRFEQRTGYNTGGKITPDLIRRLEALKS